jgi:hypothetical protein
MDPITPETANQIHYNGIIDMEIQWINGRLKDGHRIMPYYHTSSAIKKPAILDHIIKIYTEKGWGIQYIKGNWFKAHKLIFREDENYTDELI